MGAQRAPHGLHPTGRGATTTGGHRPIRRLTVVALACAALLSLPATSQAGSIRNPDERAAAQRCSHGHVDGCLLRASLHYQVPYSLLRGISSCESGLRPRAIYGNPTNQAIDLTVWQRDRATGLMQFKPSTYAATPYAKHGKASIFEAKWNALAGAWLITRVGTSPWAASRPCWG